MSSKKQPVGDPAPVTMNRGSGDEIAPGDGRERYLFTANRIIHGARNEEYGHPIEDFERIAAMWSAFLGVEIDRKQVAAMMILLKVGRLAHNVDHVDSWIDIAGYAGCADRIQRRLDGIE